MKRLLISLKLALFLMFFSVYQVYGAEPSSKWLKNQWEASWICCPGKSVYDYGVYHFRKSFFLNDIPSSFVINISADNRYRLFVNGQDIGCGPERGDIAHWYFETFDIAPYLKKGNNTLAVLVWNLGENSPVAQMTLRTGLIVQGNSGQEKVVNTNKSWKVFCDTAYSPSVDRRYYSGCNDIINGLTYPWGWEKTIYDDGQWAEARVMERGQPYGFGDKVDRVLIPRDIPMMEEYIQRMSSVRRSEGITISPLFLEGLSPLIVPPHQKISFLIDQKVLTTAYPEMLISNGKGSSVKITYSEALYKNGQKGNRDEIEGKKIDGYYDQFFPDGGKDRLFSTLWFKTYRYIQVDIQTGNDSLTVQDFYGKYTAYPFKENGFFKTDVAGIDKIWTVGWRTARLCAHETYFDCPYYEQLQYIGDTRIQALISLYVDGDDRLMRKAIKSFDWSRSYEGITTSRYPSRFLQYIPPYSMFWVNMVHDFWMFRDDQQFIRECIPGIKTVLDWFASKVDPSTGMLGPIPYWNFVDWANQWKAGVPSCGSEGGSSVMTLQFAYTLKDAIDLLNCYGEPELAKKYKTLYRNLIKSTNKLCWDPARQLFSDDIKHSAYSQHANILAILSDALPSKMQRPLFEKLNSDTSLIQTTFYFKYYLIQAMKKAGLGDRYLSMLTPWQNMIDMGLTTFSEKPEPTRSDCHAWSASPNYDLLATVCGIGPAEPGFKSVRIEPHLGMANKIHGRVPYKSGFIEVNLEKNSTLIKGTISLPENLNGQFIWKNKKMKIVPGINNIECKTGL